MKKNILIVMSALFLFAPALHAQILDRGNLMGPGAPPPMVGIELGLGQHRQNGTFQASCRCEFDNGTGSGFLGGLLFELPIDYEWTFGLGVRFDFKTYSSTTTVLDTATVTFSANNNVAAGSFYFERDGAVKETFMTLAPFVRYELARNGPFVQIGPGIGFLLASSFIHSRVLNSTTITLTTIDSPKTTFTIQDVRFQNGTRQETLQSGKIVNANGTRISALATVGWNLSVGDNAVIAPMITYDFPFTLVRNDFNGPDGANGWKISSLFFSVGLKYKLD
jgi:hypothetical protein